MPSAPNRLDDLRAIAAAHPEINRMADGPFAPNRGGLTQLAAQRFGLPFGRKSRDGSATNLSDDALCYKLGGDRFEIYDILSGATGDVQWNFAGEFANGENGVFVAVPGATPIDDPGPTTPTRDPSGPPASGPVKADPALLAALEAIRQAVEAADTHNVAKLDELKVAFIKGAGDIGKELTALVSGGGLSALLSGILGKK